MWVKGNLHCHSNQSADGEVPVTELCQWYSTREYALLAITDHNSVTDLTAVSPQGYLALVPRSVEIGDQTENILAIGVADMPPRARTSQETIDGIRSRGGISILAHPNWRWNHWTADDLVNLHGYDGIEVLNTHMRECEGHESALHLFDEVPLEENESWHSETTTLDTLVISPSGLLGRKQEKPEDTQLPPTS